LTRKNDGNIPFTLHTISMHFFLPSAAEFVYTSPMPQRSGILLLVSGPSGSGKTTLCRRLADEGEASYSTSCTTRPARPGEVHGHDYFFLCTEDFQQKVSAGEFLEHATVHGNFYGTLRQEVIDQLTQGHDVVMDIDVQGAAQVRGCANPHIRLALVDIFVMPPSEYELRTRLTARNTDVEEIIALRMKNAMEEMAHWPSYQYRLLSATREEDYTRFKALLMAERLRVSRLHQP
jgi:guanylate kinase